MTTIKEIAAHFAEIQPRVATPIQPSEIKIGLKFIPIGKTKSVYTVTDIIDHVSRLTGRAFYTEYATTHEFMGQPIGGTVNLVTIQRGIMQNGPVD
jgi:hypothetical protein